MRRAMPRSTDGAARNVALSPGEFAADIPRSTMLFGTGGEPLDLGRSRRKSLGSDAANLSNNEKAAQRFDLRDYAGLDLTGSNSNATLLQKAINQAISERARLHVPVGTIVLDSPITINGSCSIVGESCGTGREAAGYGTEATATATNFLFAHDGKGFALDGQGVMFDWVQFKDCMTSRLQPEPTSVIGSFVPGDQDYDYDVWNASGLQLQNVCILNAARGINMRGGGGIGRLWTDNLSGQPLRVGVNVELSADVMRMSNTHFWPFWKDHPEVHRWTLRNCDHLYLKRCDTPLISNYFSIAARSALRIGSNEYGGMGKAKIVNFDADYGGNNIWFDETAVNCWAYISNVSLQGAIPTGLANTPGLSDRVNVLMEGAGNNFLFMNGVEMSGASGSAVRLLTSGQRCEIGGGFWLQEYGNSSQPDTNTEPGVYASGGATFVLNGQINNTLPGPGPLAGGAGRFIGIRKAYAPGVVPQSGSFPNASLIDAEYIEDGYHVSGTVNVLVTDAGSATGYIDIGLPTALDISFGATALDLTDNTVLSAVTVSAGSSPASVRVHKPGGGNVGVSGHTINLTFNYARKAG